jgi:hypothetical protein
MIPSVQIDATDEENWWIGIPILNTDQFCWLEFREDECLSDVAKRFLNACPMGIVYSSLRSNIYFGGDDEDPRNLNVYEVECMRSKIQYFMIASGEYAHQDWEAMQHCVCVPRNELNLIKFCKDYLMTFPDKIEKD